MEAVYAVAEREKFSITKEVTNINGDSCLMIDTNSKRWIIKSSEIYEQAMLLSEQMIAILDVININR